MYNHTGPFETMGARDGLKSPSSADQCISAPVSFLSRHDDLSLRLVTRLETPPPLRGPSLLDPFET